MRLPLIVLVLALGFTSGTAFASGRLGLMAQIDAILATDSDLPQSVLDEVKALREDGQEQHEQEKHDKSVETLNQALFLLGET